MSGNALIEFSYISKAKHPFTHLELVHLFDNSFKFNEAHKITGVLFYENQYFVQILEGSQSNISFLWKKIRNDARHEIVRELDFQEIVERNFPKWGMRFFGADRIAKYIPELRGYLDGLPEHDEQLLTLMRSVRDLK